MKWSAGRKLVVCAWVTVLLTLLVGVSALGVAHHLSRKLTWTIESSAHHQFMAGQIAADAERLENLERQLTIATMLQQIPAADQARRDLAAAEESMGRNLVEFAKAEANGQAGQQLQGLLSSFESFRNQNQRVLEKLQAQKMDEALADMNSILLPRLAQINREARRVFQSEEAILDALGKDAESTRALRPTSRRS
jgi:beta-glucosidase/6-phospho-beta-glucosidase/beta-galactosidase